MTPRPLEDALRSLPHRPGRSDWGDLESRIAALKPPRPPRWHRIARRRTVLAGIGFLVALGVSAVVWHQQSSQETLWMDAHRDAIGHDPWGDPWLAAAVETSR